MPTRRSKRQWIGRIQTRNAASMKSEDGVLRYYYYARSVHLERLRDARPGKFIYTRCHYDWDPEAVPNGVSVRQGGMLVVLWVLLRTRVRFIEVNEPMWFRVLPRVTLIAVAARLKSIFGSDVCVVTYAIENADPVPRIAATAHVPLAIARVIARVAVGLPIYASLRRVAFGSQGAQDNYAAVLSARALRKVTKRTFVAVPRPSIPSNAGPGKRPGRIVFLGRFEIRKGVDVAISAWPAVYDACGGSAVFVGNGPLLGDVLRLQASHENVDVLIDPPRALISATLAEAQVLVLPSRRDGYWREQVGLPIVEGLAHGCEIVASCETGLAGWLRDHGHRVIDGPPDAEAFAYALIGAVTHARDVPELLAELPEQDGRLAADAWMLS